MAETSTTLFRIEYGQEHVDIGKELEVYAQHRDHVRILDATKVGDQIRWTYAVMWHGNGDREGSNDGS